jgi:protein involved in polysaccharide export with SLBB domain
VKRFLSLVSIFLTILPAVFPQTATTQEELTPTDVITQNTLLALSSPDYRVTAGDIYTLAYAAAGTPVTYRIIVDSTYRIPISNLGRINAAGKTYRQLKTEAEAIVSNNYPLSGAQLVLTQPASFRVYITGEVSALTERTTWALARVSSLLDSAAAPRNTGNTANTSATTNTSTATRTTPGTALTILTDYSSLRDITITSSSGQTKTYDLFQAQRYGDLTQDPYLRPGDTIRINRIDRVVSITGSVERPGTYQLLPGENLAELVTRYASNITPTADPSRIELIRYVAAETDSGDKIYLSEQDISNN